MKPSARLLAQWRIELEVHRPQQAGLPYAGYRVGPYREVVLYRNLDVGVPTFHRHRANASDDDVIDQHRRIRLQRTDIRDLNVIDVRSRTAAHRAGQRQRVQSVKRAAG